ncbi:MAG TPA: PHB depolymerase family esterase [Labilithrix sp.]|jgi:poly(hydroxyalkanoate) depolymerase family esterase
MKTHEALLFVILTACGDSPTTTAGSGGPSTCPPKTTTMDLPMSAGAGGIAEVTSFGDNPGALQMFVHAPSSMHASAVILALHGCTESASDYVDVGWNDVADRTGAVVVYAQQTAQNDATRCFRWWLPEHTTRGQGEAASIAQMVAYAKQTYGAEHAYVTGLSAGAAMTAVMLAAYPDIFEAGAIMSGLPYDCAKTQLDAFSCMNPGKDQPAAAWGALVPDLARMHPPRVAIWHGDADYVVNSKNELELVRQWTAVNGVSEEPTSTETVGPAKHALYGDRVESWLVSGMSHGVALAPSQGCGKAGAYLLDENLCSTEKAAAFFGLSGSASPSSSSSSGCP